MNNILLGKVIKAMYKLSGKSLNQLADETGLTIDTLNNLFYARLQKPGFFGVEQVVEATGYTVEELIGFMNLAKDMPEDADITGEFAKYSISVKETGPVVKSANAIVKSNDGSVDSADVSLQIKALNEQHEKQLDRFRATHLYYVDEINARYQDQIHQLQNVNQQLKEHYDHSVGELKKSHGREVTDLQNDVIRLRKTVRWLIAALIIVLIFAGVAAYFYK